MIPTDTENNQLSEFGEEPQTQSLSQTFKQLQVDSAAEGFDAAVVDSRTPGKQYIIVGLVLAVSAGLLWFMRDQGLGVGFASGDEVKIEYEVDENAAAEDHEKQQRLMHDLSLTDNPNQVPVEELNKNPFEMSILTNDDDETEVAQVEVREEPKGPTPEEIRARELQRTFDGLKLNTVLRGRVSLARIDGRTYRVGDVVESEFLLLSIDDRSVTLGADGKTYILELDSN
ncbi:MAG: hypothetical protein Phyf2KO_21710 [Phycisphaerales bacterium]